MEDTAEAPERTAEPTKRRALGRGLESLLPAKPAEPVPAALAAVKTGEPREIPLENIERNPYQTRKYFDKEKLSELAASIRANGVVQPITVRPLADDRFQLVVGERRWLASREAGKTTIPAVIGHFSDVQALEVTIIENMQRADLNPMEQARAFERLGREFKLTQEYMSLQTGSKRSTISNFLRLLKLPESVQEKLESGELSFGHAKALLALEAPELIERAAQRVVARSMSVRQTDDYVQGFLGPGTKKSRPGEDAPIDPNVRAVQDQLQQALGLRVRIVENNDRGYVIVEFATVDEFQTLLAVLSGKPRNQVKG